MPTKSNPPITPDRKPASRSGLLSAGLLVCLCAAAGAARADIYMYVDGSGTPNFSNVPTDSRYVLAMRTGDRGADARAGGPGVDLARQKEYAPQISRAAAAYHLDPALLHAVITAESGYHARAVSKKGAIGLMQLMPATAKRYGVNDAFDPAQNIRAGTEHLHNLLLRFDGNLPLALAAYNAGSNAVLRYGQVPPFPETESYVPRVMEWYRRYQRKFDRQGNISGM